MDRLSEYDHVEREALRKGISRQPDPLPRGAVVAGEPRELEVVGWRDRYVRPSGSKGSWSLWELERHCGPAPEYEREPLTPLLPAQERIRALEEERDKLASTFKVAAERVTSPDWPEREQRALGWLYDAAKMEGSVAETILAMLLEHTEAECRAATATHDAEVRLEELRPVVRAALQYKHQEPFFEPVQALSPATREWAEGEET